MIFMKNLADNLIIFGAKYLIFVLAVAAFLYFLKQDRAAQKQMAVFAILVLPLSYLTAKLSSLFFYNPRPFVDGSVVPLFSHAADNGFPSDHTLFASAVAAVILYFDRKVGALLFAAVILVGLARVLAGVHHAIDIVGSILIVLAVYFAAYKFLFPVALKLLKQDK